MSASELLWRIANQGTQLPDIVHSQSCRRRATVLWSRFIREGGGVRQGCLIPFADPGYQEPTQDEIREAVRRAGLTGAAAGKVLGVTGRTIRRWVGGEREMPYAAWRR